MTGKNLDRVFNLALVALLVLFAAVGPLVLGPFDLLQLSTFTAMALATLGLAVAWGHVGILSFGHAAFFGLGAYSYAITVINLSDSTLAIVSEALPGVTPETRRMVLLGNVCPAARQEA